MGGCPSDERLPRWTDATNFLTGIAPRVERKATFLVRAAGVALVITYDIDPAARLVWLKYQGTTPDREEWDSLVTTVLEDPSLEPGFNFLADGRLLALTEPTPFFEHIISFLALHATKLGDCRIAIVMGDDALFGIDRPPELAIHTGKAIRTFNSLDSAREWLSGPKAKEPSPVAGKSQLN